MNTPTQTSLRQATHYRDVLAAQLEVRVRRNPRYSLRAYARDLELPPNHLGEILAGKRGMSARLATQLGEKLQLKGQELGYFRDLAGGEHGRSPREREAARQRAEAYRGMMAYRELDREAFDLLADWVPMAIIELAKLPRFLPEARWIADSLKIPLARADQALERLERAGVLDRRAKKWTFHALNLIVPGGPPAETVRRYHERVLQRALQALREQPAEERDFSSLLVAASPSRLPWLRERLARLLREADAELTAGDEPDRELYCVALQAFRVTALGVLLFALAACSPAKAPPPRGQIVGNGGDELRLRLEEGRRHALGVLERVAGRNWERNEKTWWENHREALLTGLRSAPHQWAANLPDFCPPDTCACTVPGSAVSYFSYQHCKFASKQEAGRLLLVEEHHRVSAESDPLAEQSAADRFATAVYEAWRAAGHFEAPHTLELSPPFPVFVSDRALWSGRELVLLQPWGIHSYDPMSDRWRDWKVDEKTEWPWRWAGHAEWMRGALQLVADCDTPAEQASVVRFDTSLGKFVTQLASGPTRRRGARYFVDGNRLVIWGGSRCDDPTPHTDGEVVDVASGAVSALPELPRAAARSGAAVSLFRGKLYVWGGIQEAGNEASTHHGMSLDPTGARQWTELPRAGAPPTATRTGAFSELGATLFYFDPFVSYPRGYSPESNAWKPAASPRFTVRRGARAEQAANGSSLLVLIDNQADLFDGEQWEGPLTTPVLEGVEPALIAWTGMEWVVWRSGRGYRLLP